MLYLSPPTIDCFLTQQRWFYPKPCVCNVLNALEMRVGKCTRKPDEKYIIKNLSPLVDVLAAYCQAGPCKYEDVYAHYSGPKRARYQRAHVNLLKQGKIVREDQAKVKMFVKMEAYKFDYEKPYPDCRAIQFRSFEYTLQLASIIRRAEHRMYLAADVPGFGVGRHFGKNMSPRALGQALRRTYDSLPGCKILLLDVSRFDAHVSPELIKNVEHRFWKKATHHPQLNELLKWKLRNKGSARVGDDWVTYEVNGERMSGDADTGGSNSIDMAAALGSLCKVNGIHEFGMNVNGDDSVLFYCGNLSDEAVLKHFNSIGMEVKIDGRPERFEEIDYCQARPVRIDGGWTMVRNPSKVLTKVGFTHKRQGVSNYLKRVYTTCLGELALARGVPILQPYLERILFLTKSQMNKRSAKRPILKSAITDSYRLSGWLPSDWQSGRTLPISIEARASFSRAFGVSITEQLAMEDKIRNWWADYVKTSRGWPLLEPWEWTGPERERW